MDLRQSMQTASRTTGGRRANVLRATFGAVQIALALMLVTGAGLFLRSFAILQEADLGFQPERVLSFQLPLPREVQEVARASAFYREVAERMGQVPRIRNVGMINYLPLGGNAFGWGFLIRGRELLPAAKLHTLSIESSAGICFPP